MHRAPRIRMLAWAWALLVGVAGAHAHTDGTLAPDTPWATPYYLVDSGEPGPTVMVVGGVHGNEPAGARAAEQVRHWPILRGRLLVVPRANRPGLAAMIRFMPGEPEDRRDLNRRFADPTRRAEHPIVRDLWALVERFEPDWLLDLHEGFDFHRINADSVGSSVIHRRGDDLNAAADAMIEAVNATIDDPDRRLVALRRTGPARGSLARAASDAGVRAMILETTFKGQRLPVRTRQHRTMIACLLGRLGMINADTPRPMTPAHTESLRVAIYDDGGVASAGPTRIETVLASTGAVARRVDAADIAAGALGAFDVVIFPGGSGSAQARSLAEDGARRVRAFVAGGGGCVVIRTEVADHGAPAGLTFDTSAIIAGPFGSGRAVAIGPHPELTASLHPMLMRAIRWSAGIDEPEPAPRAVPTP